MVIVLGVIIVTMAVIFKKPYLLEIYMEDIYIYIFTGKENLEFAPF